MCSSNRADPRVTQGHWPPLPCILRPPLCSSLSDVGYPLITTHTSYPTPVTIQQVTTSKAPLELSDPGPREEIADYRWALYTFR